MVGGKTMTTNKELLASIAAGQQAQTDALTALATALQGNAQPTKATPTKAKKARGKKAKKAAKQPEGLDSKLGRIGGRLNQAYGTITQAQEYFDEPEMTRIARNVRDCEKKLAKLYEKYNVTAELYALQ